METLPADRRPGDREAGTHEAPARETPAHGAPAHEGCQDERCGARECRAADEAFDVFARGCPSRSTLEHVAGRWGLLVLVGLHRGPLRFNALRRRVDGVSEKMLSQTLQSLERDGLVHREVHTAIPPRVEYSLTPLGLGTAAKLSDLIDHLEVNMPAVLEAREAYDLRRAEGGG